MSLINKMLQDLDERRASALEREGVSRHVRTLPPQQVVRRNGFLLGFAGVLCGATVVWFAVQWRDEARPSAVSERSLPPAIVLPPVELAATTAEDSPSNEMRAPALKLDHSIEAVEAVKPIAKAAPKPPVPPAVAEPEPEPAPSAPARIEKQPRTPAISETADAAYRKGMSQIKRGLAADAVASLRVALQQDPRHLAARQALLSLLVDQRQWQEAEATGMEGLALDPKQSGWAMLVARLQVERGDIAAAVKTLDQYAQNADRNPDYLSFHALLLQKANRLPEAVEHYRAALAIKPDEGRWWYGLGLALEAGKHPAEAKQAYAQARASANLPADIAAAAEQKLNGH